MILLICGSAAVTSHTRLLVVALGERLRARGVEVLAIDAAGLGLPIADPAYHHCPQCHPDPRVREWVEIVDRVDAVVLATPVYHGSYSGVLKNLLDQLRSDAFRNKVVGLMSHGGGARSASSVCDHLRTVVRTLYGYATQTQVLTGREDFAHDEGAIVLVSADVADRLDRLADELAYLAPLLAGRDIPKED